MDIIKGKNKYKPSITPPDELIIINEEGFLSIKGENDIQKMQF